MFNNKLWELIFKGVLLPIFDNVNNAGESHLLKEDNEWLNTCMSSIRSLVELFTYFFNDIAFMLDDFLVLFTRCVLQESESIARIGSTCFMEMIVSNCTRWTPDQWITICSAFAYMVKNNLPKYILTNQAKKGLNIEELKPIDNLSESTELRKSQSEGDKSQPVIINTDELIELKIKKIQSECELGENLNDKLRKLTLKSSWDPVVVDWKSVRGKCVVQILLIQAVKDTIISQFNYLTSDHILILLESLETCSYFCFDANHDINLIKSTASVVGLVRLIVKMEIDSVGCYLSILFNMYASDSKQKGQVSEPLLIRKAEDLIKEFSKTGAGVSLSADEQQYLNAKVPIIEQLLQGYLNFTDSQFCKHAAYFYPMFCELMLAPSRDIRLILKQVFTRIGYFTLTNGQSINNAHASI